MKLPVRDVVDQFRQGPFLSRTTQIHVVKTQPHVHQSVTAIDRWLARQMLAVVGDPPVVLKLWDEQAVAPPCQKPIAEIIYRDRLSMLKTIINPELHWGDLYCTGKIDFEGDLAGFMHTIYRNLEQKKTGNLQRRIIDLFTHRRIANSHARAERNIHHHYDIGNRFYELWLDDDLMQYTCAYYPRSDMSLEQAQIAKLHHICNKLQLKPGDRVVEAGCGWGGLARFMAKNYGVEVTAYNISRQQVAFAQQHSKDDGLDDRVHYVLDDYRNISGRYDVFVSVGMLEHVGRPDYPLLGRVIARCLNAEGRGLIHTIGRNVPGPMNAWIERRIFPGAYPPTIKEMMDIFEAGHFSILDIENLRLHYSQTLSHWLERFENNREQIQTMMDDQFIKAWRLYLEGSIAAFEFGDLQLFQLLFARSENNAIPWSREHIYSNRTRLNLDRNE